MISLSFTRLPGVPPRGNVAAIEPYNHTPIHKPQTQTVAPTQNEEAQQKPLLKYNQPTFNHQQVQQSNQGQTIAKSQQQTTVDEDDDDNLPEPPPIPPPMVTTNEVTTSPHLQRLSEFALNKSDPKYQTLPYNTKFSVNYVKSSQQNNLGSVLLKMVGNVEQKVKSLEEDKTEKNVIDGLHGMTVHSTPLSGANKSVATPLGSPTTSDTTNPNYFTTTSSIVSQSSFPAMVTSSMVSDMVTQSSSPSIVSGMVTQSSSPSLVSGMVTQSSSPSGMVTQSSSPAIVTSSLVSGMVTTMAQSTTVAQQAMAQVTSPLNAPVMAVSSPVVMGDVSRPPRPVAQIKSIGRVAPQSKQINNNNTQVRENVKF